MSSFELNNRVDVSFVSRSQQWDHGEDARTALSDKQMRTGPRYPVDRYLVESSKNIEMVNIIDDDLWNPEPALRPEDEIILRKLHNMLQSTADDLKILSGELSKFHEAGVQIKTAPTPLDEEFNEKVHIEELVNAKFHGRKIIAKSPQAAEQTTFRGVTDKLMPVLNVQWRKVNNTGVQVNMASTLQTKPVNRNLGISRTKLIQISGRRQDSKNSEKLNNHKVVNNAPAVAYNEFYYKYVEPIGNENSRKVLQVQEMPSINIRSELKKQKVLNIDILPDCTEGKKIEKSKNNVSVFTIQRETEPKQVPVINEPVQYKQPNYYTPVRKIHKMSTCDSSGSTNNVSSDDPVMLQTKIRAGFIRNPPKTRSSVVHSNRSVKSRKELKKTTHRNLEEWKMKLSKVYGPSSSSKNVSVSKNKTNKRTDSAKVTLSPTKLNNAGYIPYSQLTLGGVRVSDIEKEISQIPNKSDVPLSPILDRILNSRENSPRKHKKKESPRVLTTSDENLLQEVLDIEKTISETISKNLSKKSNEAPHECTVTNNGSDGINDESYLDDFEDDKSDNSAKCPINGNKKEIFKKSGSEENSRTASINYLEPKTSKLQNITYTKTPNLSFKETVDIFEFVPSVNRQDMGTQSSIARRIMPKETQTSPRDGNQNIQPIRNDLWPSINPSSEVQNIFKLEKDFIKKLIIDEYGDMLEKNFTKPSTSKDSMMECDKNIAAYQKNTQTSPARVKSIMTSPKRTKTRTTSPLVLSMADQQTSPIIVATEDVSVNVNIDNEDLDISVNLSSPRFSLRLPHNSGDVLSRLGSCSKTNIVSKSKTNPKLSSQSSSTSIDADNSSSEISSLGEIKLKLNRRLKAKRVPNISETSSTSTISLYSSDGLSCGIIPLRSVGEISGEPAHKVKSDGEASVDLLK